MGRQAPGGQPTPKHAIQQALIGSRPRSSRLGAIAAAGLLISCSSAYSGVAGFTTVDVGCPTQQVGEHCPTRPLTARIVVVDGQGRTAGRAVSDGEGKFELALPPGAYDLQAFNTGGTPLPHAEPVAVTVRPGEITRVTIQFDSGVR